MRRSKRHLLITSPLLRTPFLPPLLRLARCNFGILLRCLFSLRVAFDFLLELQVFPCRKMDRMIEPWKWSLLADGSLMLPSRPPGSALTTRISVTLDPRIEVFQVFCSGKNECTFSELHLICLPASQRCRSRDQHNSMTSNSPGHASLWDVSAAHNTYNATFLASQMWHCLHVH